jgi:hypothetical protein
VYNADPKVDECTALVLGYPDELTAPNGFLNADSAAAIKGGERLALGDEANEEDLLTCYAHCKRGVRTNALGYLDGEVAEKKQMLDILLNDVECLHTMPHGMSAAFDEGVRLWTDKWKGMGQARMVKWFTDAWLGVNKRWSRAHAPPGLPSTTNGLEGRNNTIKILLDRIRNTAMKAINDLAQTVLVGRCRLTVSNPELKVHLVLALETKM